MTDLETPDSSTYEEARLLRGFGLYHSKAWHEFLALTFAWKVGCLLERDSGGNIALPIPVVRKRDLTRGLADVSLPLSHYVPPLTTMTNKSSSNLLNCACGFTLWFMEQEI